MNLGDEIFDGQPTSSPRTNRPKPIRPYKGARPRRQVPKVVKRTSSFYRDVLHILDPVAGPVNALITFVLVAWHVWFHPAYHWQGVVAGVGVILVELFLLSWMDKLYRTAQPDDPKNLASMAALGLIMLGVFGGIAFRWFEWVPTMLLTFAVPMSMPGILVYLKDKVERRSVRSEIEAEMKEQRDATQQHLASVAAVLMQVNEVVPGVNQSIAESSKLVSDAGTLFGTLIDQQAYLDRQVAARVQAEKPAVAEQIRGELQTQLNKIVAEKDATIGALQAQLAELLQSHPSGGLPDLPIPQPPSDASQAIVHSDVVR